MRGRWRGAGMALAAVVIAASLARAHETDQYSVPSGRQFADLEGYFSEALYGVYERALATLNRQISNCLRDGHPTTAAERFYRPETVLNTVYHSMPLWVTWVEPLESRLLSAEQRANYPGLLTVYHPPSWIYHHPLLVFDPTKLPRLVRCGTLMINGVYVGTDKLMHFAHMGHYYAEAFYHARAGGKSAEDAMRAAVALGTGPHPFLSEATWLGLVSTGVWSNSDLAVNYCGMLFFRNLTETVRIAGREYPPIYVRDGALWRLNDGVRPDADLFGRYVTDHWDEVLTPNVYAPGVGGFVRAEIAKRCAYVHEWYVDQHLCRRSEEELRAIMTELTTYFGADYGFRGDIADMINVITVCDLAADGDCGRADNPHGRDALGRTALWWAAADGDGARCRQLISAGADVHSGDVDGETPLHAAARCGSTSAVSALIQAGANVRATALYATTPLHLAARGGHLAVCELLLAAHADANCTDDFGCTPLWDAVHAGNLELARRLVSSGADVRAAGPGPQPLSALARRRGHADLAAWLAQLEGEAR